MFKQLRMKLTLINLLTVGLVMIIVLSGIYMGLQRTLSNQYERVMRFATAPSNDINRKARPVPPEFQRHLAECFAAKKNKADGSYTWISDYKPLEKDELNQLAKMTEKKEAPKGYLSFNGQEFHYLKDDRNKEILVFIDRRFESELLNHLIGTYVLIGTVIMALLTISSLFLADRALVPIKTSWERQKNFIADASHELRSPLAVIRSNLDVVLMNPEETVESQMRWLQNIQSESIRMSKMVQDLLLLARADAHQEQMNWELCDLSKRIGQACDKMQASAKAKDIELVCTMTSEKTLNLNVFGDEYHLQQLLMILLDNAVKYTGTGGLVEVKASLDSDNRKDFVVIRVKDTGCGIAKEHQDKIFERFYRVDAARSRSESGTGLGLSIAKWIVESHKGTLRVSSELGAGSTFTVRIPSGKKVEASL